MYLLPGSSVLQWPAGIGFSARSVKLDRLPGWEKGSYGYHGDDGNAFEGSGTGKPYGPVFVAGDFCLKWRQILPPAVV